MGNGECTSRELMRLAGIEPTQRPWEGRVMPLDQSRFNLQYRLTFYRYFLFQTHEKQVLCHDTHILSQ